MSISQVNQLVILTLLVVGTAICMFINIVTISVTVRGTSVALVYFLGAAHIWQIDNLAKALTNYSDH